MNATTPNFGNVASGSSNTNFVLDATSGNVTESGTASFLPSSVTSRSTPTVITVNCSGGSACSNDMTVTVETGTPTTNGGPLGAISAFAVSFSGATAVYKSGTTSGSGPITFKIAGVGNNNSKTFRLGLTVPLTANSSGYGTAKYKISVSATSVTGTFSTADVQANVTAPLSISRVNELDFGTLVQIKNQTGSVSFPAAGMGGTWNLTNMVQLKPHQIGYWKITGNASSQISVSVTANPLTRSGSPSLTMAVSHTAQGTQFLNSSGEKYFYIGGSIASIPYNPGVQLTGTYKGSYTITVNYP